MPEFALLILDFDGVCTRPMREQVEHPTDRPDRTEALDVVSAARRSGVTTIVLSNEIDTAWADRFPVLSAVDHVVNCADNRIYKPDRRAFQRCVLLAGTTAERTIVVDDGEDNVTVARSLGMTAVHFDVAEPATSWAAVGRLLAP